MVAEIKAMEVWYGSDSLVSQHSGVQKTVVSMQTRSEKSQRNRHKIPIPNPIAAR